MKIQCVKGTPEQMLAQFKSRIDELDDINIDSSFDYPDDLIDLENGEYESHATEPINAYSEISDEDVIDWLSEHDQAYQDCQNYFGVDDLNEVDPIQINNWICEHDQLFEDFVRHFGLETDEIEECDSPIRAAVSYDDVTVTDEGVQEVLDFLANKGYDASSSEVINYANAVARYMEISRQAWKQTGERFSYGLNDWYRDTQSNYPDELAELPTIDSCQSVMSATSNSVRLHVEWYPYDRYGGGGSKKKANFSADNMMEALAELADRLLLYVTPEDILGDEEYPGEYDTPEEVIDSIQGSNGDGCDYITLLQDRDTGEVLIEGWDEDEEEDWDDE